MKVARRDGRHAAPGSSGYCPLAGVVQSPGHDRTVGLQGHGVSISRRDGHHPAQSRDGHIRLARVVQSPGHHRTVGLQRNGVIASYGNRRHPALRRGGHIRFVSVVGIGVSPHDHGVGRARAGDARAGQQPKEEKQGKEVSRLFQTVLWLRPPRSARRGGDEGGGIPHAMFVFHLLGLVSGYLAPGWLTAHRFLQRSRGEVTKPFDSLRELGLRVFKVDPGPGQRGSPA